jgi:hypothetical protein
MRLWSIRRESSESADDTNLDSRWQLRPLAICGENRNLLDQTQRETATVAPRQAQRARQWTQASSDHRLFFVERYDTQLQISQGGFRRLKSGWSVGRVGEDFREIDA